MGARIVCWFSCGVASAVATRLAVRDYPSDQVVIANCASTLSSEHPDNERFMRDCESWFGKPILRLYSERYKDVWDVWERTGWLVGVGGARCTTELKKRVRRDFALPDDIQVFGFDATEKDRAKRFKEQNPDVDPRFPLIEAGYTKREAFDILRSAKIEIPAMYNLGYQNNNCIGCVKGQSGYWNKIRQDFPTVFNRMALLERKLNAAINKTYIGGKRVRVFLDELDPTAGRYDTEPDIECGLFCGQNEIIGKEDIDEAHEAETDEAAQKEVEQPHGPAGD